MSFDARVFALLDVNCVRSSAAHAISISCMHTRARRIRFAREMPGPESSSETAFTLKVRPVAQCLRWWHVIAAEDTMVEVLIWSRLFH